MIKLLLLLILLNTYQLFSQETNENIAICSVEALRIREAPATTSQIVGRLYLEEKCQLLSRTSYLENIDDIESFWFKIRKTDGTIGYVYGAYLYILDPYFLGKIQHPQKGNIQIYKPFSMLKVYLENARLRYFESEIEKQVAGEYYLIHKDESGTVLVINDDYEYGWINTDDIVRDDYYDPILKFSSVDDIGNSKMANKFLEYSLSRKGYNIVRNGDVISFSNIYGSLELNDKQDEYSQNIIDVINEKFLIISTLFYEGIAYGIYNLETNEYKEIGYSRPSYSPNHKYFYCFGTFYSEAPNIKIYKVDDNGAYLQLDYHFERIDNLFDEYISTKWLINHEIEVLFKKSRYRISQENDRWIVRDLNL